MNRSMILIEGGQMSVEDSEDPQKEQFRYGAW